jgi:sortase A
MRSSDHGRSGDATGLELGQAILAAPEVPVKKHYQSYLHSVDGEFRVRIILDKRPLRLILKWTQRTLFSAAALTFLYCAVTIADAWIFQRREHRRLEQMSVHATAATNLAAPSQTLAVSSEGLIGIIEISRLGISVIVVEGDDENTLRRAAGHIPNTGLPGRPGNVGIAAHRDTFFRPLRHVKRNDVVIFKTPAGEYRYRVVSVKIVKPAEVWVLNPDDGNQILTLVTCYPFYFVGSAPDRFIVRAERIA